MTGITRSNAVSDETAESIFSVLNNLEVVTTISEKYVDCFGFAEEEVFAALEEYGLEGKLIREGNADIKKTFERLLQGESIQEEIDEQIVYNQLSVKKMPCGVCSRSGLYSTAW